jgi:hypothetical protein
MGAVRLRTALDSRSSRSGHHRRPPGIIRCTPRGLSHQGLRTAPAGVRKVATWPPMRGAGEWSQGVSLNLGRLPYPRPCPECPRDPAKNPCGRDSAARPLIDDRVLRARARAEGWATLNSWTRSGPSHGRAQARLSSGAGVLDHSRAEHGRLGGGGAPRRLPERGAGWASPRDVTGVEGGINHAGRGGGY